MTTTATPEAPPDRRKAYLVDDDLGLDFLRDADGGGWFSRCGDVFLARRRLGKDKVRHDVWISVPDAWIDASDLFGRYAGGTVPCLAIDRWFPGTTAAGHRYNIHARWFVQTDVDLATFDEAKRAAAHRLRAVRATR